MHQTALLTLLPIYGRFHRMEPSDPDATTPAAIVSVPSSGDYEMGGIQARLDALLARGEDKYIAAVDYILAAGAKNQASDIHLESFTNRMRVRMRIQGELHEAGFMAKPHEEGFLARLKVISRLVTYRKRLPQDGRIKMSFGSRTMELRISFFPTIHGEKAVLRFLSGAQTLRRLHELGLGADLLRKFEERLEKLQGTILLTGPAGSGKTSTMYAALTYVRDRRMGRCNIMTIEDPVEYALDGINQCQANPAAGMVFAQGLRSILRQDPDVIMIGEIRDRETAEIAIQAGLTGHLIISTLHSGSAAGVFTRLVNLEIEPYIVASSLTAVVSQRLVRQVCPDCSAEDKPSARLLGQFPSPERFAGFAFKKGRGCPRCKMTGYSGRTGVFELLLVDDDLRDLVLEKASTRKITDALKAKGHKDLFTDGLDKVREGYTTVEELLRLA